MKPTHFGVKSLLFFAAITGAFYAAPYVNLFFLLIVFFGAHWVLSAWWTFSNLRGLEVVIQDPEPIPAGSTSALPWAVLGPRRRFGLTLRVELESGERGHGELVFTGGEASPKLRFPALTRGVHRARRVTVSSTYPLGLLTRTVALELRPELHVYPDPIGSTTAADHLAMSEPAEEDSRHLGPQGRTQPAGLRPHLEGEPVGDIHWRASARRGSLVVNEWEADLFEERAVVLDRQADGAVLEERLSAAAAAIVEARRSGAAIRLVSQGHDETYSASGVHWDEALRFLAGAERLRDGEPHLALEAAKGARVA